MPETIRPSRPTLTPMFRSGEMDEWYDRPAYDREDWLDYFDANWERNRAQILRLIREREAGLPKPQEQAVGPREP